MDIRKFSDNDKVYFEYGAKPIRQMVIDSLNTKGYKLYYYKDFQLIEINEVKKNTRNAWNSIWGDMIFFLNDEEYDDAMKVINTSKQLYDAQMRQIKNIKDMPMSHIYHNVLKLK